MEITGKLKGEIEVKRFYLEGMKVEMVCPKCSNSIEYEDYLSYPDMNEEFSFPCWCSECDHEWSEKVILDVKFRNIK